MSAGNAAADKATQPLGVSLQACFAKPTSPIEKAMQSHALHHQNARSLRHEFNINREQARQIVKQCAGYTTLPPEPHPGVHLRGLLPNHIWHTDVTHIPSFKSTPFVHTTMLLSLGACLPQHVPVRQQNMLSVTVSRHLPLWAFQKS